MKCFVILALLFVCAVNCLSGPDLSALFDRTVLLPPAIARGDATDTREVTLYYTVSPPNISFGLVCQIPARGWCAFGQSVFGSMTTPGSPSDTILGYTDGLGGMFATDFQLGGRLTQTDSPNICPTGFGVCEDLQTSPNCTNDVVLDSAMVTSGFSVFQWTRPLAATDMCDRAIDLTNPSFIIYALGPDNGNIDFPNNTLEHSHRSPPNLMLTFSDGVVTIPPNNTDCPNDFNNCQMVCGTRTIESCDCTDGRLAVTCDAANLSISLLLVAVALFFSWL